MDHEVPDETRPLSEGRRLPAQTLQVLDLLAGGASRETAARRAGLPYARVMAVAAAHGWPDRGALTRAARAGHAGLPVVREFRSVEELLRWAQDSGIDAVITDAERVRAGVERLSRRVERLYAAAARVDRPRPAGRAGGRSRTGAVESW